MTRERNPESKYAATYSRLYPIARIAASLSCELKVSGGDNIPDGPAVYAANHNTVLDPIWLVLAYYKQTRRPMRFLTKKEYMDGGGIDDKGRFGGIIREVVTRTGQIPVDRRKRGDNSSIELALKALDEDGDSIGIFPEGTLAERGKLNKLRSGVAQIALHADDGLGLPIVPVAITDQGKSLWRSRIHVNFGEPIETSQYNLGIRRLLPAAAKARLITSDLEEELETLTGYDRTGKFGVPGELRRRRDTRS